jgi:hypothetical protein
MSSQYDLSIASAHGLAKRPRNGIHGCLGARGEGGRMERSICITSSKVSVPSSDVFVGLDGWEGPFEV